MKGLTSGLDMAKEKLSELENRSKTLSRRQLSEEKEAKFGRGDGNRKAKIIGCNMS